MILVGKIFHIMAEVQERTLYFIKVGQSTMAHMFQDQFPKPGTEIEHNATCTTGMDLTHFRMLIFGFLNKDPDIVSDEASLIILDIKSSVCIDKNDNYTKHTRHIAIIVIFQGMAKLQNSRD